MGRSPCWEGKTEGGALAFKSYMGRGEQCPEHCKMTGNCETFFLSHS